MANLSDPGFGASARRLRVETLVWLRWLAAAGQLISVLFVHYGLGAPLPLWQCFAAVAALAAVNVGLAARFGFARQIDDGPAAALLGFDVLQLAVLLCLTGGVENPFIFLILAPVVVSAVSLPRAHTFLLFLLAGGLSLLLTFHHWPLPWVGGETAPHLPLLYRGGLWLGVAIGMAFVCVYAGRVAEEARLLSDALAATELALAREQHLSQLDGLAAAAAHELGTPLATIALVVKEMRRSPEAPPQPEDMDLLAEQTRRCREILGRLRSLDQDGGFFREAAADALLEEVAAPHRFGDCDVVVSTAGAGPAPVLPRSPGVMYGLGNLIENAVDFATGKVEARADWSHGLEICVGDDGPGFPTDVVRRFGLPYLTGRADGRRAKTEAGLGLGLFIAKTLLERSGASVRIANRAAPEQGALARIYWPPAALARLQKAGAMAQSLDEAG